MCTPGIFIAPTPVATVHRQGHEQKNFPAECTSGEGNKCAANFKIVQI